MVARPPQASFDDRWKCNEQHQDAQTCPPQHYLVDPHVPKSFTEPQRTTDAKKHEEDQRSGIRAPDPPPEVAPDGLHPARVSQRRPGSAVARAAPDQCAHPKVVHRRPAMREAADHATFEAEQSACRASQEICKCGSMEAWASTFNSSSLDRGTSEPVGLPCRALACTSTTARSRVPSTESARLLALRHLYR